MHLSIFELYCDKNTSGEMGLLNKNIALSEAILLSRDQSDIPFFNFVKKTNAENFRENGESGIN